MPLAVPSEPSVSVAQILPAALWNTNVRDAVTFLANPPIFRGYAAAVQSIPNATTTSLAIDTNEVDTYSGHSTVTNNSRYTAAVAGWYECIGRVSYAFNATGQRSVGFRINGTSDAMSQVRAMAVTTTDPTTITTTAHEFLNVGDYIEVFAFQRSGAALNTVGSESEFEVRWVHA